MFYRSQKMNLECIRVVKKGAVNDIYICRDHNTAAEALYTLLVIRDHNTARAWLEMFEKAGNPASSPCIHRFSAGDAFCLVFEYKQERPLFQFYTGSAYTLAECEAICINLIMTCMMSELPYPFLYLILRQDQLHLSKDHTVYLSYQVDLEELDGKKTERDCAVECAAILLELLESKRSQKAFSYQILEKKISRKSYDRFMDLYKDIRITAAPQKKAGLLKKIRIWFAVRQNKIFHILLILCMILGLTALISVICQLVFGDIPWIRLFLNGFKVIGTESLT